MSKFAWGDDICRGLDILPKIQVVTSDVLVDFDTKMDSTGIELVARSLKNIRMMGYGWHANGLAVAQMSFVTNIEFMERKSEAEACINIEKLEIKVGYPKNINVMISNHYKEGTCEYKAIHDHEMKHVDIYKNSLVDHANDIKRVVTGELAAHLPVIAETIEDARRRVDLRVSEAANTALSMMVKIINSENAILDTPESYMKVRSQCSDW